MANYYGFSRSSYFKVKDEEAYSKLFSRLCVDSCCAGLVYDFTRTDENGETLHGFGCYGSFDAYDVDPKEFTEDSEEHKYFFDQWCDDLSKIITEDSACLITEVGYEKLRYLIAYSTLITSHGVESFDLENIALKRAKDFGIINVQNHY